MKGLIRNLVLGVFIAQSANVVAASGKYVWDIDPGIDWSSYSGFSPGGEVRAYSADTEITLMAINIAPPEMSQESVVRVWYWNDEFRLWETPQNMPVWLTKDQQAPASEEFGLSISVDGNRIAVGAPDLAGKSGAVYVFERVNGDWNQTARIEEESRAFGRVVLAGNLMIASSLEPLDQPVYIYRFTDGQWIKEAELYGDSASTGFGRSLGIDGDRVAVGAHFEDNGTGAVYMYKYRNGSWALEQKIIAPATRYFGTSLDLNGNRLIVGAPGGTADSTTQDSLGTVHIFQRGGGGWIKEAEIAPADPHQITDLFGYSVQISPNGFAAVGAPGVECRGGCDVDGAIYLFREISASNWKQVAHVATYSAGDDVLLQGGRLWTSGDRGLNGFVFSVKPSDRGGRDAGAEVRDGVGGSSGGGSTNLGWLLVLLIASCARRLAMKV